MARRGVVAIGIDRLELDGFWLDVKRELSHGEENRRNEAVSTVTVDPDGRSRVVVDPRKWDDALIAAYVLDWSLVDGDDQPLPVSIETIEGLPAPVFDEIKAAVDAHIGGILARQADEKKTRAGVSDSAPILQSVG